MQLTKDVYLLSGGCYGIHQNVYGIALPDGASLALVDTGLGGEDLDMIRRNLREWELEDRVIAWVLITHAHFDHAGNARHFQEGGAKIVAGRSEAEGMAAGDERTIDYAYSMDFPTCETALVVKDGSVLDLCGATIRCHHVPGHTRDSMAYELCSNGKRILFTGDFLQVGRDCRYGIPGVSVGEDFSAVDTLRSMNKLRRVEADCVLGGHFQPCLTGGQSLLNTAYRDMLVRRAPRSLEE